VDVIRLTAIFGGPRPVCSSPPFVGAWLTAVSADHGWSPPVALPPLARRGAVATA
jgi:hypothetical protein